ncbi:hypothetical protein, partial [Desulfonatronospira sp. MSAO_Bac3]
YSALELEMIWSNQAVMGMELIFVCPEQKTAFTTSKWKVDGGLTAVSDSSGNRSLKGRIEAWCPFCLVEHTFSPDELPCPFKSTQDKQSTGGGDEQ